MAGSTREILRRIKGIKSTQQITKAMEMVSAVKLNRVRARAESARPYVDNMQQMMQALCASAEEISHPLLSPREEVKKILLVVVTSDRGLCGTFNVNVINAAEEFIEDLPDGYDTVIGDQGVKLSGGQRQRLSLARTLLKDPPILVLDEATAMFDPEGEAGFIAESAEILAQRTVILITHRPASLALADRIIEMGIAPT